MYMLSNIWRSQGEQTMKLGQLIEYKMRNIFLKSYTKCSGKLFSHFFLENQIWAYIYWSIIQRFYTVMDIDFNVMYTCCDVDSSFNITYIICKPHQEMDSKETLCALISNFREYKEQLLCRWWRDITKL